MAVDVVAVQKIIEWHNIRLALDNAAEMADLAGANHRSRFCLAQNSGHDVSLHSTERNDCAYQGFSFCSVFR